MKQKLCNLSCILKKMFKMYFLYHFESINFKLSESGITINRKVYIATIENKTFFKNLQPKKSIFFLLF